jgi:myosin heavy subunit
MCADWLVLCSAAACPVLRRVLAPQVCKQQEALHEHTSKLTDAKQQLQAQLSELLQHQEQLSQHKQELQQQMQQMQEQQQQHVGDKLQLQQRIEQLQASQQQLQETSSQLAAEVVAAKDHLQQNAAHSASAAAGQAGKQQQQQQRDDAALSGASGDLQLQLSVPGFTDALVSRIGEAELVPKFAEALVKQVSNSSTCHATLLHNVASGLISACDMKGKTLAEHTIHINVNAIQRIATSCCTFWLPEFCCANTSPTMPDFH